MKPVNTFISLLSILTGKETVRIRFGFAKICRIPSSNFISFEASSSVVRLFGKDLLPKQ